MSFSIDPQTRSYEKDLSNLLATIVRKEHEIEKQRALLCENDKFDCVESFRVLDSYGHGYLTPNDFSLFLSKNHIITRERECEFFVYTFAANHTSISLKEFLNMLLPKQNDLLKEQCLERRKFRPSTQKPSLPFYVEEHLALIIEQEIEYLRETESMKMELMNNYGWNFRESFKRIAAPQTYHIDKKAFSSFMLSNSHKKFGEDAFKYMLIRFNKDTNDIITMDEFCHAIFPSDFLSDSAEQKETLESPFIRYVKGEEANILEYLNGNNSQQTMQQHQQSQQQQETKERFSQQDFMYNNDMGRQTNSQQSRKFLKSSIQYDNPSNLRPSFSSKNIMPAEVQQSEQQDKQYTFLNQFIQQKQTTPLTATTTNYLNFNPSSSQNNFKNFQTSQSQNSLRNKPSKQNFISIEEQHPSNLRNQKPPIQSNRMQEYIRQKREYEENYRPGSAQAHAHVDNQYPQIQIKTINENQSELANSYLVKSQVPTPAEHYFRRSIPSQFPIGKNASTSRLGSKQNSRSQLLSDNIQN